MFSVNCKLPAPLPKCGFTGATVNSKKVSVPFSTGFTLIELLIVVSIMGLILAVAAPVFIHSQRGLKLRAAANNIAAALRTARSFAITKHGEYAVDFNLAEDRFVIVCPDPDDPQQRIILEKKFTLPENIDIYSSTFSEIYIDDPENPDYEKTFYRARFKLTGAFNGTNAQEVCIKDSHGKGKRIYIISTTGTVEIEDKTSES